MQRAIRIIILIAVVGGFLALIILGSAKSSQAAKEPWNKNMTLGDRETAEHIFYDYTDIMCPYCDKFALAMDRHLEDFKKEYVEEKNVYYEIRLTNLLASFHPDEASLVNNSTNSALTGYCAAEQEKFWEWYGWILEKLNEDYFSKGIGDSAAAKEKIPELEASYFTCVGDEIEGLDEGKLTECIARDDTKSTLRKYTSKASGIVSGGLPYYAFGSYVAKGFDGNWETEHDWKNAKLMFDAGVASKK